MFSKLFNCSRAHISKSKRCFDVKASTYYFHIKTNILPDFQICISVLLIIYSLNALLSIRISELTLFTRNKSKNVRIVGATPRNVDSGKASAKCPKNENQRY